MHSDDDQSINQTAALESLYLVSSYYPTLHNLKTISNPPYRRQIDGSGRVGFNALAQPADMDIQRAGVIDIGGFPHPLHQFAALDDFAMVVDK